MAELTNTGETVQTGERNRDASWQRARAKIIAEQELCHLCGEAVDKQAKAPDPTSPSVDHITPWSQGGTDAIENLALAHLGCNIKRGKKPLDEVRRTPYSEDWGLGF
ncbi:HNH endonuclease [Paeniglutamicibacter sp. NPDC012692]|uniref:HNH endonuclease n=1 Tax=Paeniglutamicibacter sp. NPDC012692 TaxID=3364388 RepID=UPI00368EC375